MPEECRAFGELNVFQDEELKKIGKDEVNGKLIEEEMDEETGASSEWLDRKSELIHDYETII